MTVESLNRCSLPGVGVLNRAPTLDEYRIADMTLRVESGDQHHWKYGKYRWQRLRRVIRMKEAALEHRGG